MDEKAESWRDWIGREVYDKRLDFRGKFCVDENSHIYIQYGQVDCHLTTTDFFEEKYNIDEEGNITRRGD